MLLRHVGTQGPKIARRRGSAGPVRSLDFFCSYNFTLNGTLEFVLRQGFERLHTRAKDFFETRLLGTFVGWAIPIDEAAIQEWQELKKCYLATSARMSITAEGFLATAYAHLP